MSLAEIFRKSSGSCENVKTSPANALIETRRMSIMEAFLMMFLPKKILVNNICTLWHISTVQGRKADDIPK